MRNVIKRDDNEAKCNLITRNQAIEVNARLSLIRYKYKDGRREETF